MIVVCPSCSARFQYSDVRFQGAKSKRFQCPKCSMVFEVMNPSTGEPPPTPREEAPEPKPTVYLKNFGDSSIRVPVPDDDVIRRHARIEIHADGTAWLSDLGSTNGTVTNGKVIDGPTQLSDRQEFSCGKSTFMLLIRAVDMMSMD